MPQVHEDELVVALQANHLRLRPLGGRIALEHQERSAGALELEN
jgi:hypothetical protein